jgi:hypothetical protein
MKPLVSLQILTIVAILVLLPALGDMHSLLIRDVSAITGGSMRSRLHGHTLPRKRL